MSNKNARNLILLSLCLAGIASPAFASPGGAVTVTLENDVLTGSDDSYSNGMGVTWVSDEIGAYDEDDSVSRWARLWDFLPAVGDEGYSTYSSWTVSQEMHTPDDITVADPLPGDQPYAGALSIESVLYARSARWSHAWQLQVGVVGPAAHADDVQQGFHDLIGSDEPMGWDTQLPDEPYLNAGLTSAFLWKEGRVGDSAEWRLVPVGSIGLGNYFTGVGLGMYGEIGWNLVDAFGGNSLRGGLTAASSVGVGPVEGWSVSFFGGLGGHAVGHYMPLDGSLFSDTRSVDTKPFVGSATIGASVRRGRLAVSLAGTFSTEAFDGQKQGAEFGTLSVTWFN